MSSFYLLLAIKEHLSNVINNMIYQAPERVITYNGMIPTQAHLKNKQVPTFQSIGKSNQQVENEEQEQTEETEYFRQMSDSEVVRCVKPKIYIGQLPQKTPDLYQVAPFVNILLDKAQANGRRDSIHENITYSVLLDIVLFNNHDDDYALVDLLNLADRINLALMDIKGGFLKQRFKLKQDWSWQIFDEDGDNQGWYSARFFTTWLSYDYYRKAGLAHGSY